MKKNKQIWEIEFNDSDLIEDSGEIKSNKKSEPYNWRPLINGAIMLGSMVAFSEIGKK
jgi:hypothetical protein